MVLIFMHLKTSPSVNHALKANSSEASFSQASRRADEPLSLVHSDLCGKMNEKSLSGAEYFLSFIDDKTRFVWVYFLKRKDQVFEKFIEWKTMVERSTGKKLKAIRTDNGGEFTSGKFKAHLKAEGVCHELTIPRNPEQKGVAERMNRTLVEATRSMLFMYVPSAFPNKLKASKAAPDRIAGRV